MLQGLTTIYRPNKKGTGIIKSHPRKVRLDESGRPYVIMDGMVAHLKKVRNEPAMEVIEFTEVATCRVCGRILTDENSVEMGIGPICAGIC